MRSMVYIIELLVGGFGIVASILGSSVLEPNLINFLTKKRKRDKYCQIIIIINIIIVTVISN